MKIAWSCGFCGWLQVSDSKERHKMDSCPCGKTALDLEEGYARMYGAYTPILKQETDCKEWKVINGGE